MNDEERRGGRRENAGRPSLGAAKRKTHSIKFSDEEWGRLEAKASLAGLSVAEYIRKISL